MLIISSILSRLINAIMYSHLKKNLCIIVYINIIVYYNNILKYIYCVIRMNFSRDFENQNF